VYYAGGGEMLYRGIGGISLCDRWALLGINLRESRGTYYCTGCRHVDDRTDDGTGLGDLFKPPEGGAAALFWNALADIGGVLTRRASLP